ncbi:MAG: histidine kinase [Bacteroidetes bacterium]|nr:histidine kinase [Bacteroidota bacterium]
MKNSGYVLRQLIIWTGIWSVFAFAGDNSDKLPMFYVTLALRVLGFAVFFNVMYLVLLPLYFTGRKRAFYALSPVLFALYVASSVWMDTSIAQPEKTMKRMPREMKDRSERPLSFILVPPIFLGLILFGAAASIRGFSAFENKKQAEEEANRRRLEAEIALLKSQINPHFLLNTLNNLYALSLTEPAKTPDALLKLSEMMAYILHECAQPKVPLSHDLDFIRNYIALQKLRLPPNASLHVDLPSSLGNDCQIEPMILIPFIENAFKHGLTTKQPCTLSVSLKVNDCQVVLQVENPVLPPKPNIDPSGIGMANTRQRLEHSYAGRYQLDVSNNATTYRVELKLNLQP